jgi:hypothetical protein
MILNNPPPMKYYQVVITLYRYNWLTGKWKIKEVFPSPVIQADWGDAQLWRTKFYTILLRRGWKFKEGNWGYSINELHYEPKPEYTPSPEVIAHNQSLKDKK